jgi:thiamine kinase-like enzyme
LSVDNIFKSIPFLKQVSKSTEANTHIEIYTILPSPGNPRWIVPLKSKELFISSLALYQPSLMKAKFLKKLTILAAKGGLSNLTIRNKIYFQRNDWSIKKIFNRNNLNYAFFTGTEGCHRKITVQVMDEDGIILGYIKISDNEDIDRLLNNEAEILEDLSRLKITKGLFPKVIYHGPMNNVNILALDTLKSVYSKFSSNLSDSHINFLSEIFHKTSRVMEYKESGFAKRLRKRLRCLENEKLKNLEDEKFLKLLRIIDFIEEKIGNEILPFGICHRDFTPWNTFFHNDKLYVFDWEYAEKEYPPMLDLFHFIVQDGILVKHLKPERLIKLIPKHRRLLKKYCDSLGIKDSLIMPLLLCYLIDISLLYIERENNNPVPTTSKTLHIWNEMIEIIVNSS